MSDVAAAAGVSRTTASFVLNDKDAAIPEETRQRVLEAAERLGYRPHAAARALATGRTNRVGLVLADPLYFRPGDGYFAGIMSGILEGVVASGLELLLHSAPYRDPGSFHLDLMSGSTDGVLLVGRNEDDALTRALLDAGFPVVSISYRLDRDDCWSVDCDNVQGGALAIRHLLSLGHRQIAVFYPRGASWGEARLAGARIALAEEGLPDDCLQPLYWNEDTPIDDRPDWIRCAAEFLRSEKPRPTALFCTDEARLRTIVETLPGLGIRVPQELAVVGFNSTEISERTRPSLTAVAQPLTQIGNKAVELLCQRIAGETPNSTAVVFPTQLDIRDSTLTECRAPAGTPRRP